MTSRFRGSGTGPKNLPLGDLRKHLIEKSRKLRI